MTTLTEAERDWLADVWDEETTVSVSAFYPVVARMIAARLASVEALADEWDGNIHPDPYYARQLRAVLGSDAHTEQKGAGVYAPKNQISDRWEQP